LALEPVGHHRFARAPEDDIMPQNAGRLADFSICIPTYNRARLLERSLLYLLNYSDQSFELIVGDNDSTDETAQVVASFAPRFRHFTYLRHAANLGFSRNMDAILRRATRPYIYVLSDDDFLFEGALGLVKHIMDGKPEVAAVVGQYLSVDRLVESTVVDYRDSKAVYIGAKNYALLLENNHVCDGHPFLRRELFQRHCAYWDRTIGVLPLYMRLLEYGDVAVIDKPLFQHLTNEESLSTSMTEARMLDMFNADFEMALSFPATRTLRDKLAESQQRFMQNVYLQAARMARNKKSTYLLWMFLKRLESVQGADDDLMVKAESAFMHDFMVDRLDQIIRDGDFSDLVYDTTPTCQLMVSAINEAQRKRGRIIRIAAHSVDSAVPANCLRLLEECGPEPAPATLALRDLFDQLRLTRFAARLTTFDGRLLVHYNDLSTAKMLEPPNPRFRILCLPYATS
jgi:glycosyltransferase involved in cell wall biosynthesis